MGEWGIRFGLGPGHRDVPRDRSPLIEVVGRRTEQAYRTWGRSRYRRLGRLRARPTDVQLVVQAPRVDVSGSPDQRSRVRNRELVERPPCVRRLCHIGEGEFAAAPAVPGSLAGAWGYRHELHALSRWTVVLIVPSLVGGVVGSLLVAAGFAPKPP